MAKKTYYEKLKDPRWQKKRLEVMAFNDFCCEVCGDNENTLNVHHKEYFKNQEPWDYEIRQLVCICESCHEFEHSELDVLKWVSSFANLDGPANRVELGFLIAGYMGMPYEDLLKVSSLEEHRCHRNPYKAGVAAIQICSDGISADFKKEKDL